MIMYMSYSAKFFHRVSNRILFFIFILVMSISVVMGIVINMISTRNFDFLIGNYYLQRDTEKVYELINHYFINQELHLQEAREKFKTLSGNINSQEIGQFINRKKQVFGLELVYMDTRKKEGVYLSGKTRQSFTVVQDWLQRIQNSRQSNEWILTDNLGEEKKFWILERLDNFSWMGLGTDWDQFSNMISLHTTGAKTSPFDMRNSWIGMANSQGKIIFQTGLLEEGDEIGERYLNFHTPLAKIIKFNQILVKKKNNSRYYVEILPLQFSKSTSDPLYLMVELDRGAVMPIVRQNGFIFAIIIVGFILTLLFGASMVLIRTLVYPLEQLKTAAEKISEQNYDYSLPLDRKDEFGEVARTFYTMVEKVRNQQQILEEEIDIRTQELKVTLKNLQDREEQNYQEIQFAASIQKGMMNTEKNWNEIRLNGFVRQMEEIGGDFVDCMEVKDRLLFYLSDVSGHGIPASLISIVTKMIIHYSFSSYATLDEIVNASNDKINDIISDEGISYKNYLTLFIAQVFPDYTLEYLSAGHVPALKYCAKTGQSSVLPTSSSMLGVFNKDMIQFKAVREKLEPGDKLVIFSDGFLDAKNNRDEQFGFEKIQYLVNKNGRQSGEKILEILLDYWKDHIGKESLKDDLSLLIIDRQEKTISGQK